ncbi:MAG: hypothetical protein CM15mP85_13040 [Rhodobacterales bacterium]|nr:MAG: hypothetical protein CM15mP85_13040 [Rhodobacterales bacterium]
MNLGSIILMQAVLLLRVLQRLAYNAGDVKKQQVVGSTTGNLTWGDGESGFYDFDANGAPATGAARLAYNPGILRSNRSQPL